MDVIIDEAKKSWYKLKNEELLISKGDNDDAVPLSSISTVVKGLKSVNKMRLYVPYGQREKGKLEREKYFKEGGNNESMV